MVLTKKEIKHRYFDRVYREAPMVECACGCGMLIKSKDKYGRDKHYVNGHNGRKYTDPTEYKREWSHRNRGKQYTYKQQWIHARKAMLIMEAGGVCTLCGLPFDGECTSLFDFHHRDPGDKLFNLNNTALNRYSLKKILEEAAKCDLLCANCHRLIHWDWSGNAVAAQSDLVEVEVKLTPLGVMKG